MTHPTTWSEYDAISLDDAGDGVAVLWLDRPDAGNAFTWPMQFELHDALAELDADPDVRVIVATGRGRFFSTGSDLSASGGSTFAQTEDETAELRRRVGGRVRPWQLATPIIAAINGAAVGLGLTTPLQWDIRFMARGAKYGFVFPRRGITPELGSAWLLPRIVGMGRARELLLSGRFFDADEAVRMGLATDAFEAGEVLDRTLAYARDIAVNCSPLSLAMTKYLLRTVTPLEDIEQAWSTDWELFRWIGRQADAAEGVAAFVEKRAPRWPMGKHTAPPPPPPTPWPV